MRFRGPILLALILTSVSLVVLPAATEMMPVGEIRPGMKGKGLTVFHGSERSEFSAEIIGVLENSMGPRRNLILARLAGGPLGDSGVIQGMSGSPVYVDGRLIGAVSYSLGAFAKDTIAGITPIQEMLRGDYSSLIRTARASFLPTLPIASDTLSTLLPTQLEKPNSFASNSGDVTAFCLPTATAANLGLQLKPIATPLVMNGFAPEAIAQIAPIFRSAGLAVSVGGTASSQINPATPLQAGDAVGVSLIRGDLSMAGTGTVTLVDGNRVHAFGHSFYNLGPASFPMTRAYVHTVLPSQAISSRIAAVGEIVGTIDQDRSTGISGTLGSSPRLVPVRVSLHSPGHGRLDSFNFDVVNDDLFTPLLTYNAVLSTLFSHSREVGSSTYVVSGEAKLANYQSAKFDEIFTGANATVMTALYIAGPLTALLNNGFETVTIESIDLAITSYDEVRSVELQRVWFDDPRPKPGHTVPLRIAARAHRGEEISRTIMVDLPANIRGRLQLLVADGSTLAQQERQQFGRELQATDLRQLINALNEARRNDRFYVQLLQQDAGAVVNGKSMTSLPPSVLNVINTDQSKGRLTNIRSTALREWSIPLDRVTSGSLILDIDIDGP